MGIYLRDLYRNKNKNKEETPLNNLMGVTHQEEIVAANQQRVSTATESKEDKTGKT